MQPRQPVSEAAIEAYIQRSQEGPCFVCQIVAGNADYEHHLIYADDHAIVFLSKHQVLYGYTLVAPRRHREQVTGDFTLDEYLALQRLIYRVGEALRRVVPTERLYILSLGSQQGNRHVHWHIAPLPPGVPYRQQQFEALRLENGLLQLSEEEKASLALRIRAALASASDVPA
ncbi:MAG TPA: HIT family protein [Ardenticatenaceae bacterium]|nr:HIT family protein [Ardenticatenaceae bacterium]